MSDRPDELSAVLARHADWVRRGCIGDGRANLYRADLTGADLHRADLHRADLHRADLTGADLHRADLTGANLYGANLHRANLTRADGILTVGPIGSEGRMVYAVRWPDTIMVQAGCWWGTIDDLAARVAGDGHGWPVEKVAQHRAECEAVIAYFRAVSVAKGWAS